MEQQTEKKGFWQDKAKPFYENRFKPFWLDNNKKNIKITAIVLAALIVVFAIAAGIYVSVRLGSLGSETKDPANQEQIYDDGEFSPIDSMENASSLKELLKGWATNGGQKMSSKNVINVLLLGLDESESRSDTMMIASVNKKTDQVKLISVYRDSYIYMQQENGKERYTKLNSAYTYGGPELTVKCIEDNLKIEIDYYASVNFKTFPKVIDAIGGIDIDVKEYEAKYIRRTSRYKNFPYGKQVHLNGDEALVYSRIRKSDADSDVSRAGRQRKVIEALIKKAKTANVSKLDKMAVQLLPYIRTNMSKSTILSIGSQALMQDWMDYPIEQITCPDYDTGISSRLNGLDYWIVDYPLCAYNVQMAIYGQSNIKGLNDSNRVTAIDLVRGTKEFENAKKPSKVDNNPTADYSQDIPDEEIEGTTAPSEVTEIPSEEGSNLFPSFPDFSLPERPTLPRPTKPNEPDTTKTPDVTEAPDVDE